MKNETKIWGIGFCCAGLLAASSAQAGVALSFTESGGTSATGGTDPYTSQGVQSDNETTGTLGGYSIPSPANGSTLDLTAPGSLYGSPPSGTSYFPQYGWLAIYTYLTPSSDYGTTTGLLDLIHWDNSGPGGQQMFWYSQEGSGSLADHWSSLTSSFITSVLGSHWLVSATENSSGLASYTPANFDQPGWAVYYPSGSAVSAPVASQYTFNFQSSVTPVPEPSTVIAGLLVLLPAGGSTLQILRKKRDA